jgi:hypothetical protein
MMTILQRFRFSMGTILMFVLMSGVGSALFVKVRHYAAQITEVGWKLDIPSLFLIAIALTAIALAAWKDHSAIQTMLQISLTCFGCLTFLWIAEGKYERAIRYWYQATFGLMVTLPMLGRKLVRHSIAKGPLRTWWKRTFEAMFFSWLTLMLLSIGGLVQAGVYAIAAMLIRK